MRGLAGDGCYRPEGVLTKMMVIDAGSRFWDGVFTVPHPTSLKKKKT